MITSEPTLPPPFAIDRALNEYGNTAALRAVHPLFDDVMQAYRKSAERARRIGEHRLALRFESAARSLDDNGAHWMRVVAMREQETTQRMQREEQT